jgi:hypothetical protein
MWTVVAFMQEGQPTVKLPAWLDIVLRLVPILGLILALPWVKRLGDRSSLDGRKNMLEIRRTELENEKLQIELARLHGEPPLPSAQYEKLVKELDRVNEQLASSKPSSESQTDRSPVLAYIESYIVRFLLLSLSLTAWNLIRGIVDPLTRQISNYRSLEVTLPFLGTVDSDFYVSMLFTFGDIAIFIVLGLPLLRSIAGTASLNDSRS